MLEKIMKHQQASNMYKLVVKKLQIVFHMENIKELTLSKRFLSFLEYYNFKVRENIFYPKRIFSSYLEDSMFVRSE